MDGQELRIALRNWASAVTIVSAREQDTLSGMTVSSFTSVSLEPPLILVCLYKMVQTTAIILQTQAFGVSFLAEDQIALSNRFAGFDPHFPKEANRFEGLETYQLKTGAPLLRDTSLGLDCRVHAVHDGSTHHIIVGEVVALRVTDVPLKPLIYYNQEYYGLKEKG